jgi:hypothetical protein
MKINKFPIVIFLSSLVVYSSCGTNEEPKAPVAKVEFDQVPEVDENKYSFVPPSPLQIASIFKKAGLVYDASLLNPTTKSETYSNKFKQSLNFGVYSADLAYCVKNEKYTEAGEYLNTLKSLSAKIGLETVFASENLIERFKSNIGNQDSIVEILIFVQENTDEYIEQNGKIDLAVVYYSGAWVEGMYFGAMTASQNKTNNIGMIISEQMNMANALYKGLMAVDDMSVEIEDLAESIMEFIKTYDNFESVKAIGEDSEFFDIELTQAEVEEISKKIIVLRNSIVQ